MARPDKVRLSFRGGAAPEAPVQSLEGIPMTVADLPALGSQPIRADAPSGDSARDTAEFATLQAEVRKLELPDAPAPDWNAVVDAATDILGSKSKDLLVAAYLAVGLLERDGFPGLASGLQVLRDIVTTHWETCFPELKRMRGRVAAFEWLAERGATRARRRGEFGGPAEPIDSCLAHVGEIHELLADKVDGGASLLSELRSALEEAKQGASRPPSAAPASTTSGAASSGGGPAGPASVTSPNELEQALAESKRLLRSAGEYLRTSDPTNPLAYRLPRFAVWLGIKQLPPNQDGKTSIPAPQPPDLADRLTGMLGAGQWAGVLQETEGRMAAAVLWLDLHRLACAALDGLGPDYKPAADALCAEVAALLQRLPDLPRLKFANDMPIASPETRAWIEQRVLAGASAGTGAKGAPAHRAAAGDVDETTQALEAVRAEAWEHAKAKRLTDAVTTLEKAAVATPRLRDRAGLRLEAAQICMDQGQHDAALALLEALDGELGRSEAGDWEPGLCVEVIKSLLLCRQKVLSSMRPPPSEEVQRTRVLLSRLARLDVVAALDLDTRR
jgi:type VI secretion system protein VasJ